MSEINEASAVTEATQVAETEATPVAEAVRPVEVVETVVTPVAPVLTLVEKEVETNDDIFVSESDTFTAIVRYYKEKDDIKVEKVDDDFDEKNDKIKTISFTCKYPSQGDYQSMLYSGVYKDINETINGIDLVKLEMTRLSLLLRGWSINKPIGDLISADPKIVRSMLVSVTEKIGMKCIF